MSAPLLVLTGPATPKAAAPWMAAAEQAGWRAELRPIARTLAVEIERTSVDVAPPALLAVSSPNATLGSSLRSTVAGSAPALICSQTSAIRVL